MKQEKPEMDDEERKKNFSSRGKIVRTYLRGTLEKILKNIFASSFVSENSKNYFLFWEKKLHFLVRGEADASAKN